MKIPFFALFFIHGAFGRCSNDTHALHSVRVSEPELRVVPRAVSDSLIQKERNIVKMEGLDSLKHPVFRSDTVVMNEEYPLLIFRKSHKPAYYVVAESGENDNFVLRFFVANAKNQWNLRDTLEVTPFLDSDSVAWKVQDMNRDGMEDLWFMVDSYSSKQKIYQVVTLSLNPTPKITALLPLLSNPQYLKKRNVIESESYDNRKQLFRKSYYQIQGGELKLTQEVKVKTNDD